MIDSTAIINNLNDLSRGDDIVVVADDEVAASVVDRPYHDAAERDDFGVITGELIVRIAPHDDRKWSSGTIYATETRPGEWDPPSLSLIRIDRGGDEKYHNAGEVITVRETDH